MCCSGFYTAMQIHYLKCMYVVNPKELCNRFTKKNVFFKHIEKVLALYSLMPLCRVVEIALTFF